MTRHKVEEGKRYEDVVVDNGPGVSASVKIYTREKAGGYKVHEVADYSTGARRLRSFSDHGDAVKEATRIATLMARGETTAAQIKGADAASYGRALELLRETGVSLEVACAHYAESFKITGGDRVVEAAKHLKATDPDKLTRRTVKETVDELIAARESRGSSPRYVQDLRARLNRFANDFAVDVDSVSTADLQRWFDKLKGSAQTRKNFRTVLGTLFNFAEARGYVMKGRNPIEGTEAVKAKRSRPLRLYTPDEGAKLLAAASPEFLPSLAIGLFAGLRSSEIERLDYSDIDLKSGHIVAAGKKEGTPSRRIVPILPNLKAWLAPFARKSGKVWAGLPDFGNARQETAEAAGITWKPNAMRDTFVSCRLMMTQNAQQVAIEAGNSVGTIHKHYRQLVKKKDAKAWFALKPERPANVTSMPKAKTA